MAFKHGQFQALNASDANLLIQALALAAEQYDGFARDFRKLATSPVEAYGRLAEQFDDQAARVRAMVEFFNGDDVAEDDAEGIAFDPGRFIRKDS